VPLCIIVQLSEGTCPAAQQLRIHILRPRCESRFDASGLSLLKRYRAATSGVNRPRLNAATLGADWTRAAPGWQPAWIRLEHSLVQAPDKVAAVDRFCRQDGLLTRASARVLTGPPRTDPSTPLLAHCPIFGCKRVRLVDAHV
jgi:hypothetical protein